MIQFLLCLTGIFLSFALVILRWFPFMVGKPDLGWFEFGILCCFIFDFFFHAGKFIDTLHGEEGEDA